MATDWSAFQAFMDRLEAARAELKFGPNQECFYRGHTCDAHALQPTLLRDGRADWEPKRLQQLEARLFFEFRARARELHALRLSGWDYLGYMRHHGLPTRLLDWTESLSAALFFAVNTRPGRGRDETPCLWLLNPYALNGGDLVAPEDLGWDDQRQLYYDYHELLLEPEYVDWDRPIAIYPMQRSPRMAAQRGWFTIHGRDGRPLDEIDRVRHECLRRVPLGEAGDVVRSLLGLMGIDEYLLFPDLDSLAETLMRRYGLHK